MRNLEGRFGSFLPAPGECDGNVFCRMSPGSAVAQLYDLRHVTTFHSKPQFSQVQNGDKDSPQEPPSGEDRPDVGAELGRALVLYTLFLVAVGQFFHAASFL